MIFLNLMEMAICFISVRNVDEFILGKSKHGTRNLKRHSKLCKKKNFRDIGQALSNSRSGSLGKRHPDF